MVWAERCARLLRLWDSRHTELCVAMSDPFARASQSLTDALLQLDQVISLAESNVVAARQIGLPESAEMAARLPALTLRAREFLASIPVANQAQRWGENRRLL